MTEIGASFELRALTPEQRVIYEERRASAMARPERTRQRIVDEAKRWLRTPWRHGTGLLGVGCDCIHLLHVCYLAAGLVSSDLRIVDSYPQHWHFHRGEELYLCGLEYFLRPTEKPSPGDIAAYTYGRTVSHAGIIIDKEYLIHAYQPWGGVVMTELRALQNRLHGYLTWCWSD